MEIKFTVQSKVIKRSVYTLLDMVGDIGGLHDGLLVITSLLLGIYNASVFDGALAGTLVKF